MAGTIWRASAFLVLLVSTAAQAAWMPVGPFGGDARSLAAVRSNPDRMYVGTGTGQVYFSSDGGRMWNRLAGLEAPSDWVVDNLSIDPAQPQSRLTVFFRILLAVPAILLTYVFRLVNQIVAFLGWFYCLATGRMSEGMRNISAWLLRYEVQTYGYLMLLTGRYPSLEGAPSA